MLRIQGGMVGQKNESTHLHGVIDVANVPHQATEQ